MVVKKSSPITKGRKFKQVLEGARKVFLRDGYAGASVDDIAAEAKVSKATLYSYFPDKEVMFSEVFRAELALDAEEPMNPTASERPVAEALPLVVRTLAAQTVSGHGINSYRMRVGESARFPELAREYIEASHRRRRAYVRDHLERWVRRGEMEIDDIELASEQLIALAEASIRDRAIFLGYESVTEAQLVKATAGASQVFLAAYGASYSGSPRFAGDKSSMRSSDRAKTVPPME